MRWFLMFLLALPAFADTLTDTDGALIIEDTFLWKGKPTLDKSSATRIICAGDNTFPAGNLQRRFIIKWDLSGTALVGSTINTAKVNFEVFRGLSTARSIGVLRILPQTPAMNWTGTTWNYYAGSFNVWQAGGATGAGDSVAFSPNITLNGPTAAGSWDFTGLAAAVQDAMDSRSGILSLIWMPYLWSTTAKDFFSVDSVDHATGSSRPTLIVDYTLPGDGGIVIFRRRIEGHATIYEPTWADRSRNLRLCSAA